MEENQGNGVDGISELITDLGKGQVLGEKMYEFVKEHLNRKVSPTSSNAQFTFVVNLLHIKSFSRMSNVTFNATMKLLQKRFLEACLPYSFDEAMKYLYFPWDLAMKKSMFVKIIVYCFCQMFRSGQPIGVLIPVV
jgi:hypothetical protein